MPPVHDDTATINGRAYRWQVVGMLWLVCFFDYADRQAIYSVFPLAECDFHFWPLQLGLLGSAFAWICAIVGLLAGMLVDRISKKTASLGGLEVWSLVCAATALSGRFTTLLLFRHRRPRRITLLPCLYVHWRRLSSR
jgi:predicted MFS family arabinose efflux permease